jgi:hypothetical protein
MIHMIQELFGQTVREFSSWCPPVVVRPVLDKEQIEPAGEGSSDNGFVFGRLRSLL